MDQASRLNYNGTQAVSAADMKFGVLIVDEYSDFVERHIGAMLDMLRRLGCLDNDIVVKQIPSLGDTVLGVQFFAEYTDVDGVLVVMPAEKLYANQALLGGIVHLQMQWNMPVCIGGSERASDIVEMVALQCEMEAAAPEQGERPKFS